MSPLYHWTAAAKRGLAESGVSLEEFDAVLTSPTATCKNIERQLYSYLEGGLYVLFDRNRRRIASVGFDLSPETLEGWYFSNRARAHCRDLKTTPKDVVESMEDSDVFPAQNSHTLYRGLFDILVHEGKSRVVDVGPVDSLDHKRQRSAIRRSSGGTPVGAMPQNMNDFLRRTQHAGFAVSTTGSGHIKIWKSGTPGLGKSVVVPATGSDWRGMMNSIMEARTAFGVDLRSM